MTNNGICIYFEVAALELLFRVGILLGRFPLRHSFHFCTRLGDWPNRKSGE